MSKKNLIAYTALVTLGCSSLTFMQSAHAFNLGNMMNPSKWFGSSSDRRYRDDYYYDRYYGGPYGYGRGYGPGWGGYGPGWGGYPGYGGYGPGWGGYGYGYPGYAVPQTQQRAPDPVPQ